MSTRPIVMYVVAAIMLDASFRIYMPNTKAQMVAKDVARVYSLYVALVAVLHLIVWLAMKVFRAN